MTASRHIYKQVIRNPKRRIKKENHYHRVNACTNCGNSDTHKIVRLRCSYFYCGECGSEFMSDEKF